VPPVNIPVPGFGLSEVPGPVSVYVDEATGSDFNSGAPAHPRRTIPLLLSAGTVVQVNGRYTTNHESPNQITAQGTVAQPVFILGGQFQNTGQISGTYFIVDGGSGPGGWFIDNATHGAFRNYISGGGFPVVTYNGPTSDIVFYNVKVDLGYTNQTEASGDWHCVGVGKGSTRVWVLDSNLSNCRGDGIQVNGEQGGEVTTGPVYVGRVTCVHNRQSCVWAKQSHDVIVSTSSMSKMRPDADYTNPGVCGGGQYFALRLVFVNNDCFDSENGFRIAGYNPEAYGIATPDDTSGIGLIGNRIRNIHALGPVKNDPANLFSPGSAVMLDGASRRYLQDNVIDDVDSGIAVARGTYEGTNNVVTNVHTGPVVAPPPPPPPTDTRPLCSSITPVFPNRFLAALLRLCR